MADQDQTLQPTNQIAISNQPTPAPEQPPIVPGPSSLLNIPSAATAAALGTLLHQPGDLFAAGKAAFEAAKKAPFQNVEDQPSLSSVSQQYTGQPVSPWVGLAMNVMGDPTNLMGGEDVFTQTGKAATMAGLMAPDMVKGVSGLVSRFITDVLPKIGKGMKAQSILPLVERAIPVDELTPTFINWLRSDPSAVLTPGELAQKFDEYGIPSRLGETRLGAWEAAPDEVMHEPLNAKWGRRYVLPGGDNHRELLIRYTPHQPFNLDQLQWRQLEAPESYAYLRPSEIQSGLTAHLSNAPTRTYIVEHHIGSNRFELRSEAPLDTSHFFPTLDDAKKAFTNAMTGRSWKYIHPDQRLLPRAEGGWTWHADGVPDVHVVPTGENSRVHPWVPDEPEVPMYRVMSQQGSSDRANPLNIAIQHAHSVHAGQVTPVKTVYTQDAHFNQDNPLVHARVSDHVLPDWGRALNAEEIQSDWHNHEDNGGRYYGYVKPNGEWLPPDIKFKQEDDGTWTASPTAYNKHPRLGGGENGHPIIGNGATQAEALEHVRQRLQANAPPDAPYKGDKSIEMAFKRLLVEAANKHYAALTWTTGMQQAERYNRALKDIQAMKLVVDRVKDDKPIYGLWARVKGEWTKVPGDFRSPQDVARVSDDVSTRMIAGGARPERYAFTVRHAGTGTEQTFEYQTHRQADEAWEEQNRLHPPQIESWHDVPVTTRDAAQEKFIELMRSTPERQAQAEAFATNLAERRMKEEAAFRTADDEPSMIFPAAKKAVEGYAREHGIADLNMDEMGYSAHGDSWSPDRYIDLQRRDLVTHDGSRVPDHDWHGIQRAFAEEAARVRQARLAKHLNDYRTGPEWYADLQSGRDAAYHDMWSEQGYDERLHWMREHGIIPPWDGYVVSGPEHHPGGWYADLTDHPLTIGSKGMEQEYDQQLVKLGNTLSKRFGDGTQVEKLGIDNGGASIHRIADVGAPRGQGRRYLYTDSGFSFPVTNWSDDDAAEGRYVVLDGDGKPIAFDGVKTFTLRDDARAAVKGHMSTQDVWGLRIGDKLRTYIKEHGLPLSTILWPALGSTVLMHNGNRVRVTKHNDDGTFEGDVVKQ